MKQKKTAEINKSNKDEHSELHRAIKHEMETEWPAWKVNIDNEQYAISAHSKKIVRKTCE